MAETVFQVWDIIASLKNKTIYIQLSKEPDPDTVNQDSIFVLNRNSKVLELIDFNIDGNVIEVSFVTDPEPNTDYSVYVQTTVKSLIEGLPLQQAIIRNLVFESEVTSECKLLAPTNFERTKKLSFSWDETGENLEHFYRLQVAQENIFSVPVIDSVISEQTEIDFTKALPSGQYYARVRAEKANAESRTDVGKWSPVISFIYYQEDETVPTDPAEVEDNSEDPDESSHIIEDRIEADEANSISYSFEDIYELLPENIKITFTKDIDASEASVSVIRRDI